MTERIQYVSDQPISVGFIPTEVFDDLNRINPSSIGVASWFRSSLSGSFSTHAGAAGHALRSITDRLDDYVVTDLKKATKAIRYDFQNSTVELGVSQRGIGWHVDGGTAQHVMVASDIIPTEFLVADDQSTDAEARRKELLNELSNDSISMFNSRSIEIGISDGVFKIYQPEPYEAVVLTKQIHRSTVNLGNSAIQRTFLRGWIHTR